MNFIKNICSFAPCTGHLHTFFSCAASKIFMRPRYGSRPALGLRARAAPINFSSSFVFFRGSFFFYCSISIIGTQWVRVRRGDWSFCQINKCINTLGLHGETAKRGEGGWVHTHPTSFSIAFILKMDSRQDHHFRFVYANRAHFA